MASDTKTMRWHDWVIPAFVHVLLGAGVFVTWIVFAPRYQRTFADFNMQLPALTKVVIDGARWMGDYWWVVVSALMLISIVYPLFYFLIGGWHRPFGRVWFWLVVALLLLCWSVIMWAFQQPMWDLLKGLNK